eukprot:s3747_g2.t1
MSSPGTGMECGEDRQLLAEATAALQEHLDFEEKHVQQKRQQLEEELDQKIPAKFAKGEKDKDCKNPSPSDTIRLNVGGDTSFTTRRDTLTAIPGSRLALLFSGRWDKSLRRDENGRLFLDVDPVQFRALLAWLVDLKRIEPDAPSPSPPVDSLPRHCRAGFLSLCSYLCCRDVCVTQKHISDVKRDDSVRSLSKSHSELRESTLVSRDQARQLSAWLKEASRVGAEPCLKLLFRASRDGFNMQGCHQKCDAQGPTVVVARSAGGHLFGGYTETAWDSSNSYKACQESFLFRLAGPGNIQPSKHCIFQNHQNGIHCGPTFVQFGGDDMRIYAEGAAGMVIFNIGPTYSQTTPQGNFTYLAESKQAVVTDFEVFQVCGCVDLRTAAQSLRSHADLLKSQLEQSEQDLLEKALTVCTAALNQGSGLLAARDSLSSWCDALDEEAQFLSQFMGTSAEIVRLNVGGQLLETLHSTVTFVSDSTLASKFAENWTLQDEEVVEGGIFFDEDPDLFQVVLLHLRLGKLLGNTFSPKLAPGKRGPWQRLLKYLNLQAAIKECWDSELLTHEGDELLSMLQESGPSSDRQVALKLLFRASRDGFNMQGYHQKCDAQGPTVVVARSAGGHLFGGYTETAWDSSNSYKACQESFLFRLAGPGNIQPSKHCIFQNHKNGIHCGPTWVQFGGGDMRIYAEGAAGKVNFNIGPTYSQTTPQGNFTYLAESQQAVVTDFEVFAVVRENVQSSPSSATGGLSAGIGSSLLTPSKSGKLARLPSKLKRPTLPRAVTEAASKYLRASEALAKLRWQRSQLADSHPLLRLGQAAAEEEALAGLESDALRALEMNEGWEGNDQEWSALQGLWRQLRRDVAEARTASIHSASTALEEAAGDSTEGAGSEGGRYDRSARLASDEEEDAEGSHHDSRHGQRNLPRASAWSEDGKAMGLGGIGGPSGLERAAQRLAKLEEELELQQQELTRYHQMEHGEDGGVLLVGHALLHQRQLEKLAAQRDICRKELQELLEAASREGWSEEQLAACEKLAARCQDLDHALRSCTEKSALLREDAQKVLTSKGGSSAFGAAIAAAFNASDAELQAALSEALRRMANFDHDLEQQRAALKRRRKKEPGAMADDDSLTALVVGKGQALSQCQDFAGKMPAQAWNLIVSTWHGKLTDGLERLAMRADVEGVEDSSEDEDARQHRRFLVDRGEAVDPSAALQEARRRLAQLAEEAERQRLGLKRRQRRARGDEGSDDEGCQEEQTLRSSAISAWGDAADAAGKSGEIELLRRAQRGMGRSAWTDDPAASADDFYPSSLAEAAQRLAGFEEQLRAQQKSLRRLEQQKRSGEADDVLLAEHALLNQGALEALAAERGRCRRQLQKLLQVAEAEGWSQDQRAAYDQLVAQCQRLEESFKSLDQTAEMLQQGTEEAVAAPGATSAIEALKAALAGKVDDPELRAALDAALKRLASFDSDLEQQRAALKRRRVRSSSSTSGAHDATELSALVELIDGRSDALSQYEDFAQKLPSELWQLILSLWRGKLTDDLQHLLEKILGPDVSQDDASEGGGDGRRSRLRFNRDEPVDTDAALREARCRLMQLAEEEARQRARLAQRRRKQKAGAEHEEEASPGSADDPASRSRRLKVKPGFDNEEARRAVAEAARRLANFEDQLELQRCGLQRRRVQKQSGEVDDVTLLGYALLHHGELEALAAERQGCLSDCDRLLQVAGREGWSSEDVGACEQLAARCRDLDDSFRSCAQTAAQLKQDASKAAPLRLEDSERQAALEEALRRVARFDHDVEAQREALSRRRRKGATGGEAAVDAVLAALLEQHREARLQCEEQGRDSPSEAWSLLDSLWSGKLTESLEQLTVHVSVRVQEPSSEESQRSSRQPGRSGAVDTSAEMAEARRRLAQLSEDAERQRLGLRARRRRGKAEEAVKEELEQIAASGAEFGALAVEHCEGLQDQEKSLSEVMQRDSEAMDEIEAWRQLVGLEELQAAASKMSERLQDEATGKTVADLTGLSPSRLKRQGTKGDFSTDTSAAKQQCEEMKARLQELREEEEERQRLLLQRRQRRKRQEPPEDAEEAALEAEARSRELLLKAHEPWLQQLLCLRLRRRLRQIPRISAGVCSRSEDIYVAHYRRCEVSDASSYNIGVPLLVHGRWKRFHQLQDPWLRWPRQHMLVRYILLELFVLL